MQKPKHEPVNLSEFAGMVRRLVAEGKAIGLPHSRIRDLEGLDVVIDAIQHARDGR